MTAAGWHRGSMQRFRRYDDSELDAAILVLLDWRNHSVGPVADLHQAVLLAACEVRDERAAQAREISDIGVPTAEIIPDGN